MWTVFLFIAIFSLLAGTYSAAVARAVTMTVSPTEASRGPGTSVMVMCRSDQSLLGCNFRVWFTDIDDARKNKDYPQMDFGRGNASEKIEEAKYDSGTGLYKAEYFGKGLAEKECGILFTPSKGRYLLGCRGRAEKGGWGYGFMSLYVNYDQLENDRNDPRGGKFITVANASGKAEIKHTPKKYHVVRGCKFYQRLDPNPIEVLRGPSSSSSPGRYQTDRDDASCSLTVKNVTEEDNGLWWYLATSNSSSEPLRQYLYFHIIIITRAPTADNVTLRLVGHEGAYAPGDVLTATCTASGSRPVANISWLLGGDTIRSDAVDDAADRAWRWPWDVESITRTVTRKLSAADIGKMLTCRVEHQMLVGYLEKTIQVNVTDGQTPTGTLNPDSDGATATTNTRTHSLAVPSPNPAQSGRNIPGTGKDNTNTETQLNRNSARPDPVPIPSPPQPGTTFPGPDSDPPLNTTVAVVIAATSVVLLLSIVAAVVYAKVAGRCCFLSAGSVPNAAPVPNDRRGRENPAKRSSNATGKPRAPSPGGTGASMTLTRLGDEDAVVYAEIAGAKTSGDTAKKLPLEETTYAELSFQ